MAQLENPKLRERPSEMIQIVVDAGYEDYLKDNFANYRNRREDLEQLASFALQFKSLEDFLSQLALLANIEAEDDRPAHNNDTEQIKLSTIHQAKGLEFGVVFLIMLCDGLFPSVRSLERPENEEEERRLFYVAITRARNELYVSYPLVRVTAGQGALLQQKSRFLQDIPEELTEAWNLQSRGVYG